MKKFSLLIVCLCAGLTFVSQAQDTGRVAPASGDTPSLNGGRPSPWDRPIGPGPKPIVACSNGSSWSGDVTDDGGSSGSPLDALTKAIIRPNGSTGGDTPSLNGGRPSPWDRPIGPGPKPIVACSNGSSWSGDVTDDGGSSGSPLDALTKAWLKPSGGSGDTVRAPHQGEGGISTVTGMIDGLLNGSTDVPDVNGDGKADISDVTTAINLLLRAQ